MATPRKPKSLSFEIAGSAPELPGIIEQIAAKAGTHTIHFVPNGATLKNVTDRIRRIPRQRGLNALTVKATPADDGSFRLDVTNTGTTAVPWPKPAKKAPAKKSTKGAVKATVKPDVLAKAIAKSKPLGKGVVVGKASSALMESIQGSK